MSPRAAHAGIGRSGNALLTPADVCAEDLDLLAEEILRLGICVKARLHGSAL
jgi:hypothetical protein